MKSRTQTRWALVGTARGTIFSNTIRYCRKDVIKDVIAEERRYSVNARHADLSDAQFWRIVKRKRGYIVRRISMRVMR
ncbi:hypothetical protein I6F35_33580 [Bradyrhizobium sp. BRP22]|uniref:hypothetical protein n=1 Tax=Bradyrhizobium sp. BRP22 TaxID=2793821 RepID=UPI001CD3C4D1|nr:hypothetical protein [Bradyrhizobium sp. BRP22]MCA1458067.1 hypothetical protein [Bradyrhizobium sp. BRP22]